MHGFTTSYTQGPHIHVTASFMLILYSPSGNNYQGLIALNAFQYNIGSEISLPADKKNTWEWCCPHFICK